MAALFVLYYFLERRIYMNVRKFILLSLLVAIGFVLSPILRVPGMAPMQHFINVVTAVLLGPSYAFLGAIAISVLRMMLLGINILALTGSVFGAVLAGLIYRRTTKVWGAVIGEIIGTGIIGAIVSFYAVSFLYGSKEVALFTFVPSFILGTLIGTTVAYVFLEKLLSSDMLENINKQLER